MGGWEVYNNMDWSAFTTFISNVGFPIAVCLACFWYINKQGEQHKEEMTRFSEAVNNNTLVMQKLVDKLGEE